MSFFSVQIRHGLSAKKAESVLEKVCEHYHSKYFRHIMFWRKISATDFESGVRINGTDGVLRATVLPTKIILSLEAPEDTLIENLLRFLVEKETEGWFEQFVDKSG